MKVDSRFDIKERSIKLMLVDDLRPFISLAIELIVSHSHRIRIATQEIHKGLFNQAKNFLAGRTGRDGRVGLNDKLEMYPLSAPPDASLSTWTKSRYSTVNKCASCSRPYQTRKLWNPH